MDTDLLLKTLKKGRELTIDDELAIKSAVSLKKFKKKEFLQKENQHCRWLYFINTGFTRSYFNGRSGEVTYLFTGKEKFVTPAAFFDQSYSKEAIIAEEPTETLRLSYPDLEALCHSSENIRKAFRYQFVQYVHFLTGRIQSVLGDDSKGRVKKLFSEYRDILQRVKPEHAASYVNVSRAVLYRILRKL